MFIVFKIFCMYKNKLFICNIKLIPYITCYMIPVDLYQKYLSINNFTTDDMTYMLELFSTNKTNSLYLTEIMQTYWLQMLDEYWEKIDSTYSNYFDLWS